MIALAMTRTFPSSTDAGAAETAKERNERLCEAQAYIGMFLELAGRTDEARAAYKACVATGVTRYLEYDWASARLAQFAR